MKTLLIVSRMFRAVCVFSTHELRGLKFNRLLMASLSSDSEITSRVYAKTIVLFNLGE